MKHFELGQMHKVDINEGFKEIKTAPERKKQQVYVSGDGRTKETGS